MYKFGWHDIHDIIIELEEQYPDTEILSLSFPRLRKLVESLKNFSDQNNPTEGILEAIQMEWLEERE